MFERKDRKRLKKDAFLSFYFNTSFVNKEGKVINANELTFIGSGENSSIWKYKDKAMKIFFIDCYRWSLSYNSYLKMKNLPLRRILNAKDSYYECTNQPIVYEKPNAYIMNYVEERKTSLLDIPTSNLIRDTKLLEEDAKILAANRMKMIDVKMYNSIISKEYELFFSDTDLYRIDNKHTEEEILDKNIEKIYWFFETYLAKELEDLEFSHKLTSEEHTKALGKVYELLDSKLTESKVHDNLEKLFSNYKTPKEYFLSLRK